jgi:hypothetical protein
MYFCSHIIHLLLEWETFQRSRENKNTHFMFSNVFFSKLVTVMR